MSDEIKEREEKEGERKGKKGRLKGISNSHAKCQPKAKCQQSTYKRLRDLIPAMWETPLWGRLNRGSDWHTVPFCTLPNSHFSARLPRKLYLDGLNDQRDLIRPAMHPGRGKRRSGVTGLGFTPREANKSQIANETGIFLFLHLKYPVQYAVSKSTQTQQRAHSKPRFHLLSRQNEIVLFYVTHELGWPRHSYTAKYWFIVLALFPFL